MYEVVILYLVRILICTFILQYRGWEEQPKTCAALVNSLRDLVETSGGLSDAPMDAVCACLVRLAVSNVPDLDTSVLELMLELLLKNKSHVSMFVHGGGHGGILWEKTEQMKSVTLAVVAQKMCESCLVSLIEKFSNACSQIYHANSMIFTQQKSYHTIQTIIFPTAQLILLRHAIFFS